MSEPVSTSSGASPRASRPRSKWPERLWMLAAIVLILVSATTFFGKRLLRMVTGTGITGEVLPELEPVDHIAAQPGDLKDFNVIVITTDTTRADHIGCYGNRSVKTPNLDRLARQGILCSQAITPSPSTLPAHSSLLTGLYPYRHGARSNGTFKLADDVTTLAERLQGKGYRTGAVISSFVLDSRFGLDQGFEVYNDDLTKGMKFSAHMFRERAAELTNEPAGQWIRENAGQPFFLWVHYFDPHAVYMPPEPFRSEYADDLYDGELAYVDSQIGALLSQLDELGIRDKTLVVYTSDHGEGLGEHGEFTHSLLVYEGTMHIPLIINAPSRLPQGKVLGRQTCLIDVVPTVLSLLGQEVPDDLDGIDLSRPWDGKPRPVLIETIATMVMHGWAPLIGVRRDDFKYIVAPTPELYELTNDPDESKNLHDAKPEVVREFAERLAAWLGDDPFLATRQAVDVTRLNLDNETMANLSALGYVATVRGQKNGAPALRDPKDMIGHWETVQNAINMQSMGRGKEAVPVLEQSLAEVPGDVFARSVLAGIYRQQGDLDRAMVQFQRCAEDDPNQPTMRLGIAGVHMSRREYPQALEQIAEALKIDAQCAQAVVMQGEIAYVQGKDSEALKLFERAIEMDPGSTGPAAYNHIGFLHLQFGRLDEARAAFNNAIRIDALDGTAHDGLANILKLEGKVDEAMTELRRALYFDPNQPRAMATLGSLLSQKGENEQGLKLCQRALEISPNFAVAHNNLGLIYRRLNQLDKAERNYLEAIKHDPRLDAAHVNLAQLYRMQDKKEESLEEFRAAIKANPINPSPIALVNLGVHHFNNLRFARALMFYRRALKTDPDHALAHKYIASVYALKDFDRPGLAAFHLRRSLELEPEQADAGEMLAMLKQAEEEAARRGSEASKPLPVDPGMDKEESLLDEEHSGKGRDASAAAQNKKVADKASEQSPAPSPSHAP